MKLNKRSATNAEIEVVRDMYRALMGNSDKTALGFLIFGIISILYGIQYEQPFIGWSAVLSFTIAYRYFSINAPIEKRRRKAEDGFEVIEYEGVITAQSYGCCSNRRMALYIDAYELTNFNPSLATDNERDKWQHIKPNFTYKVTVAFLDDFRPIIFTLEEVEKSPF